MRRNRYKLGGHFYPLVWTIITLVAVYLLIRFTTLYLSDDIGQATGSISETVIAKLSIKVMESGSSLISYNTKEQKDGVSFPVKQMVSAFAIHEYTIDDIRNILPIHETTYASTDKETIKFHNVTQDYLTKEYILTNGALFQSDDSYEIDGKTYIKNTDNRLQIGFLEGELFYEESDEKHSIINDIPSTETMKANNGINFTLEQLKDINFLVNNFYIVDKSTRVTESLFNAEKLLGKDMSIKQNSDKPQILIYHTHSQEAFVDSRPGVEADTVVGIGSYLKKILEEQYGYNVIHDNTCYDVRNGILDRNLAYNYAKVGIEKILKENPSIEVVIDLHRDGVAKRSTVINGEETAQIMLFNGLSRDQNGPITHLENPNLQDNLAFSLQLQLKSFEKYPGLFYKNYLKCYRFNMHVRPKAILMELGTHENTIQSAKNAMEPFAQILDEVLQGK